MQDPYSIKPQLKQIDRRGIANNLLNGDLALFEEFNSYIKNYPALVEYTADGVLTEEELNKLLNLFNYHKDNNILSEQLHNSLHNLLIEQLS